MKPHSLMVTIRRQHFRASRFLFLVQMPPLKSLLRTQSLFLHIWLYSRTTCLAFKTSSTGAQS